MAADRRRRRLRRGVVLSAVVFCGTVSTALERFGILEPPGRVRLLALPLLIVGVALAASSGLHNQLGYGRLGESERSDRAFRDARLLAQAVTYEGCLALYFIAMGVIERYWPDETAEFLTAGAGYVALLIVCGRVHDLAARSGKSSISTKLLGSQAARDAKKALAAWKKSDPRTVPPGVGKASNWLEMIPRVGKTSAAMSFLATVVAGVALANTGSAVESAGSGVATLVIGAGLGDGSTGTQAGQATAPSVARSSAEAVGKATYEAICGADRAPGRGAPDPFARRLYALWLGEHGVGARIGGCVGPAASVRASSSVWYASGRTGSMLVSLGVANAGGTSALLLGTPARFAFGKASSGSIWSASPRVPVGYGDLQIVDTDSGSFVFVRRQIRYGDQAAAYTLVPPGLIGAWISASSADGWVWPIDDGAGLRRSFTFVTDTGRRVGEATCKDDLSCTTAIRGIKSHDDGGEHVTMDQLTSLAPEARG